MIKKIKKISPNKEHPIARLIIHTQCELFYYFLNVLWTLLIQRNGLNFYFWSSKGMYREMLAYIYIYNPHLAPRIPFLTPKKTPI